MKKWGLLLLAGLMLFASLPSVVLAQGEPPAFSLSPQFPSIVGKADTIFTFNVDVNYTGSDTRTVNLSAQGPQGWSINILGGIPDTPIASMRLQPFQTYSNSVKVQAVPPRTPLVEPGSYEITLQAKEPPPGTLSSKVTVTAVVTARYALTFTTQNSVLSTSVSEGKQTIVPLVVGNDSTVAVNNITFSSTKPQGWSVTFKPEKIDSLPVGGGQTVEATIKPPPRTIAGDYSVSLFAQSENTSNSLDIRVTVLTSTIWGWVGVLIALAVVAGLVLIFWRFGRR